MAASDFYLLLPNVDDFRHLLLTTNELCDLRDDLCHLGDNFRSLMLNIDEFRCIILGLRNLDYMIPTWDEFLLLITPLCAVEFRAI
jgi:hypothetical protein